MLTYNEFLNMYFDLDTSTEHYLTRITGNSQKIPLSNANPKEAYEEYVKNSLKIEKSYDEYLKKKQERFRKKHWK